MSEEYYYEDPIEPKPLIYIFNFRDGSDVTVDPILDGREKEFSVTPSVDFDRFMLRIDNPNRETDIREKRVLVIDRDSQVLLDRALMEYEEPFFHDSGRYITGYDEFENYDPEYDEYYTDEIATITNINTSSKVQLRHVVDGATVGFLGDPIDSWISDGSYKEVKLFWTAFSRSVEYP